MANPKDFYTRLTKLFRSGPSVRRKVKNIDTRSFYDNDLLRNNLGYRAGSPFGREASPFSVMGSYGLIDRFARYSEFVEMESTGEIAAALNIYADEAAASDDRGKSVHVFSDNTEIKKALDELFYDIINVEFNLRPWVRNLCKFGDFFLYNEVIPEHGIINVQPIPVDQVERQEGYDPADPYAVRFKWLTHGGKVLENWQITHFRILGNDFFLPYGTSILDPARRVWHQLGMLEDAMLVYRIVRSPERRVFYIDVGNTAPNDVPSYMEAAKSNLTSKSMVERQSGRMDQRYNPVSILEDYYIPKRGGVEATKIETLQGATNSTAIEDVEYIQKKLFAALQVPKAYLGYDEAIGGKATLAQQDIRFSRSITILQKMIVSELNKLAMLHLYARGFDGEDLVDFEIMLSNPSSIAVQQKLDLWGGRFDTAGAAKESGLVDESWIKKNLLGLTVQEVSEIEVGLKRDKIRLAELEAITAPEGVQQQERTVDPFDPAVYDRNPVEKELPDFGEHQPLTQTAVYPPPLGIKNDGDTAPLFNSGSADVFPINPSATPILDKHKKDRSRRVDSFGTHSPDFSSMFGTKNRDARDPYDREWLKNPLRAEGVDARTLKDLIGEKDIEKQIRGALKSSPNLSKNITSMFDCFDKAFNRGANSVILTESEKRDDDQELDFDFDENDLAEGDSPLVRVMDLEMEDEDEFEGEKDELEQKIEEELEKASS